MAGRWIKLAIHLARDAAIGLHRGFTGLVLGFALAPAAPLEMVLADLPVAAAVGPVPADTESASAAFLPALALARISGGGH